MLRIVSHFNLPLISRVLIFFLEYGILASDLEFSVSLICFFFFFFPTALCDMHPMRALFLIPRNPPPRLKSKKWWDNIFYLYISSSVSLVAKVWLNIWTPELLKLHATIPTGPKSFSVSLRAAWWRTTPSVLLQSSFWNTRSSGTSPTRGRSASSSKTTSTEPRKRGARKVGPLFSDCRSFEDTF